MKTNSVGAPKGIPHIILRDLVGQRFSSLVVLKSHSSRHNRTRWVCQCDCGKTTISTGASLRTGHKKSCGCRYQLSLLPKNETVLCWSLRSTYESLARKRGYEFSLTREQFKTLTKQNCFYCGKEPSQILKPRRDNQTLYIYNGIDRRDNTKGYIESNVVACCGICNSMKSSYPEDLFLEHIFRLSEYQNSKRQAEMACPAQ